MSARTGSSAHAPSSPPRSEPELPLETHCVHFYEEDSFLLDSLTKLIGTTLRAGQTAAVVATEPHRDELGRRLQAQGLELDAFVQLGRYVAVDAAESLSAFMVNGVPDVERFNAFAGDFLYSLQLTAKGESQNLVLFGEMVALLCSGGNFDAALKLERLWNDLASKHSIHLHCAYPIKFFDREGHSQAFLDICSEHSHVVPTENYTALANEGDRSRQICRLQQRAITAEAETAGRLRAEETLRRSEKLVATGHLAASISHEINNPLEAISNAIYLARSSSQEDAATYLDIAEEQLARVAQITKQTLGSYRQSAPPGIVKLSAVLDDLLTMHNGKLRAKNLSVKKQYRGELEVWGLEGELRQVFANQIANAIYAMPQNGCLTIRTRRSKSWSTGEPRSGTSVSIVDNGSGIRPESIARIFDPFFTTKQDVGNGLGLWITQGIVTRHGGNIRVRSNTRPAINGTIFVTFLPQLVGNPPATL
jgi:signal transduction histidine kinase